jgi:phosphomevalonate kinase
MTPPSSYTGQGALQQQQQSHLTSSNKEDITITQYDLPNNLFIVDGAVTKNTDETGILVYKVTKVRQS